MFELSQVDGKAPEKHYLPRFSDVVNYVQDSKIDVYKKFEELKGNKLSKEETKALDERINYAKIWLKDYAPKEEVFTPSGEIPKEAKNLSDKQKEYLIKVAETLGKGPDPERLQTILYDLSKEIGLPAKDAFGAIYLALIGKTHGPKAAWFLLEHKDKAIKRFEEV